MNKFVMLVGFPGAGKSTFAGELAKKNYHVYSLDNIRHEFNLYENEQLNIALAILQQRIQMSIDCGANIVYDSANLSKKQRLKVLNMIDLTNYTKYCVVFETPLDVCKERNSKRQGYARVDDEEYEIYKKLYKQPTYKEGWDLILTHKGE